MAYLTQLGQKVGVPAGPAAAIIETFPCPEDANYFAARFTCPEFTSLCPLTSQPDFAHIVIDYVPAERIIESKSLKLFLHSFRSHGAFHEACTLMIGRRLFEAAVPIWLRIAAYWYPRGGIPIDVFWQEGFIPEEVFVPPLDVPNYRGRG